MGDSCARLEQVVFSLKNPAGSTVFQKIGEELTDSVVGLNLPKGAEPVGPRVAVSRLGPGLAVEILSGAVYY